MHALLGIPWLRRTGVAVVHTMLWTFGFLLALTLRFDGPAPASTARSCVFLLLLLLFFRLAAFGALGLFNGLFRYAGLEDLKRILLASTAASLLALAATLPGPGRPRFLLLGEWLASIVLVGGVRVAIRAAYERSHRSLQRTRTLVVGANDTGESLLREVQRRCVPWEVVGFLDDDRLKQGGHVHHVRVLGPATEDALRAAIAARKVEQVIFALTEADPRPAARLVLCCRRLGVRTRVLPAVGARLVPEPLQAVRDVAVEDLLGREPVALDVAQVDAFVRGRVVLVTGAGGSIGSELARQVLRYGPARLLLFDHDENALFYIERELRAAGPGCALEAIAGDITDACRVEAVFRRFAPDLVLHAAAHKHVAMMESNACEAARNNIFGTRVLAEAAHDAGTGAFVLISTDKAVNPSSVMGATKRVCEMVVQQVARASDTRFTAVRFGNVLGSNGSVVPLFREQIARGGPVTVTHPEVTRFFMTIPEAAGLVLQAGALGTTGQIFMLDMGEPVRILALARAMIELSGLRPGEDIEIQFSGLKPGEKLTEELMLRDEASPTRPHPKIMVGRIRAPEERAFKRGLRALADAIAATDDAALRDALALLVPEATLARSTAPVATPLHVVRLRAERRRMNRPGLLPRLAQPPGVQPPLGSER